ncbi:probable RNA methyltransferase CG11342 [Dendroctonus ponderosae]|uniref:RNA methyltransferase n=1 Tax=Dendroctonus ponderosae TaxID=77166 RepID=J3JV85_DENPD|nr:probable RNA methyltransferase CG11342 [Dendroctonus ponderosae]AEE62114.1 unknown [Dendroctonus ponderosae]ERL89148.1 hypothetical protein D910_06524 [Dendroctonus ponderosae]KAH1024864.1 hypothetical protein HUJ05_004292 [Dendroctonus ponderosae]
MNELEFKCGNPGASKFGNFINYYQFHPPDERISMLAPEIWSSAFKADRGCALDVGCNSGDLTVALKDFLTNVVDTPISILGVDVDPVLIRRACEKQSPRNLTFKCLDIMSDTGDIFTDFLKPRNRTRFDIVFCFSITMWIHLNHGDDGLRKFLAKVASLSDFLVIEPQPWKCYRTAVKRLKLGKAEFPNFKALQLRNNVESEIETFIVDKCGLEKVGESGLTKWGRKLLFFKRNT